ncbi:hypothetical protein SNE40_021688 [Patella caerulea]|uniref:Uncharacterized protein n=1 Tax=Patella caerulea TaxID=87958 RepID=A0AAN8G8G9_PATCE
MACNRMMNPQPVPSIRSLKLLSVTLQRVAASYQRTQDKITTLESKLIDFEARYETAKRKDLKMMWEVRMSATQALVDVNMEFMCWKKVEYEVVKKDLEARLRRMSQHTGGEVLEEVPHIDDMDLDWSFSNLCQ